MNDNEDRMGKARAMAERMNELRTMAERPGDLLTVADLLEEVTGPDRRTRYRVDVRFDDGAPTFRRMGTACILQGVSVLRDAGVPADTVRALVEEMLALKEAEKKS